MPNDNPRGPWIVTRSGAKFYPLSPLPEEIRVEDIAYGLAGEYRFSNQCRYRYTVAQHSVYVSLFCPSPVRLQALLHDGSEGYGFKDIARPIKHRVGMDDYRAAERHLQGVIYKRFGLPEAEDSRVKEADSLVLGIEALSLMEPLVDPPAWEWCISKARDHKFRITRAWSPEEAEERFLERYHELFSGRYCFSLSDAASALSRKARDIKNNCANLFRQKTLF